MFKTLRTALCVLGALLPAALPSVATAGSYPVKPIQLIVPYGPGGDSDLTARVWAEFAKQRLGQPVVVVNKAGGGGLARNPGRGQGPAGRLHALSGPGRTGADPAPDRQRGLYL